MAGFGGAIKLTGASEYQATLKRITENVKENTSAMQLLATQYDSADKSEEAVQARTKALNDVLATQNEKLQVLKAQYMDLAPRVQEQADKHQELVTRYNNEKQKLDEIGNTLGKSSDEYKKQQSVVEDLANEVSKSTTANETNLTSLSKLQTQMNQAQSDINKTTKEIDELGNETEESGKKADEASKGGWTIFKGVIADLASKAITGAIDGLKQLGKAFFDIGQQAVQGYGEYEQQVGGVMKIFDQEGESAKNAMEASVEAMKRAKNEYNEFEETITKKTGAEMMIENAQNAFKTVGLSATEYMQTVTSFSASLLQGLQGDTATASEFADMAMRDMADNMNAFGTSMESIQSAYAGFAKDNYTMLDNLKLGYGGNATEMARLINDSKVLGENVEVTAKTVKDVPFDKIIEAIHKTQERVGILGTTSLEASNTIQGSTKAMKASWANLLVGMADDNADFTQLVNNFLSTLDDGNGGGVLNQILPRVTTAINGISKALQTLVPTLVASVAPMITENLPIIIQAVQDMLTAILNLLPTIMPTIQALIPEIVSNLVESLPLILDTGIQIILALINGIVEALPQLIEEIPRIVEELAKVIGDNAPLIFKAGITLLVELGKGLLKAIPNLIQMVGNVNDSLTEGLRNILHSIPDIGWNIVKGLWEGISSSLTWLKNKIRGWIGDVTSFIKRLFGINSPSKLFKEQIGENLALGIGEGFSDEMDDVSKMMADSIPQSFDLDPKVTGARYGATAEMDMVSAFKTALSQMKVVLDDEEVGSFVENTVARAIYA